LPRKEKHLLKFISKQRGQKEKGKKRQKKRRVLLGRLGGRRLYCRKAEGLHRDNDGVEWKTLA